MKKLFLLFLLLPTTLLASLPYHSLQFPRDEGAHYKNVPYTYNHLMEWWYFNGVATSDKGRKISFDVALFNPAIKANKVFTRPFLHIQVADMDAKKAYGSYKVYPFNSGDISTNQLYINVFDNFSLKKIDCHGASCYQLKAVLKEDGEEIGLDLLLTPKSNFFLINGNGLMPMQNNTNSYYYTIPHLAFNGKILLNEEEFNIKAHQGDAWMDHQWGDFDVSQNGWEWLSVRLNNGIIANIFLIFDYDTHEVVDGLANFILPDGSKRFIKHRDFTVTRSNYWHDAKMGVDYPLIFYFDFPQLGLNFTSHALFAEQELHGYWEGYTDVVARYQGTQVQGYSYVELVYNSPADFNIIH